MFICLIIIILLLFAMFLDFAKMIGQNQTLIDQNKRIIDLLEEKNNQKNDI